MQHCMHTHKFIYFLLLFQFPISGSEKVLKFLKSLVDYNIKQNMISNKMFVERIPRKLTGTYIRFLEEEKRFIILWKLNYDALSLEKMQNSNIIYLSIHIIHRMLHHHTYLPKYIAVISNIHTWKNTWLIMIVLIFHLYATMAGLRKIIQNFQGSVRFCLSSSCGSPDITSGDRDFNLNLKILKRFF